MKQRLDADVLRVMYGNGMSVREIARRCGYEPTTVRTWLKQASIARRSISEAKRGQKPAPHTVEASVRSRRRRPIEGRPVVGYKFRPDGYVDVWVGGEYIKEHRLIMEHALGRKLLPTEDIHHINERRDDNRLENMVVVSHADHLRMHYGDRFVDAAGRFMPGKRAREPVNAGDALTL